MTTQIYKAKPYMNIRQASEEAIRIARGLNSEVIVEFNAARFAVNADTKIQDAITAYTAVCDKIAKTQQQLTQNIK